MKSQKLITLALAVVLVLSLAACSPSAPAAVEPTPAPTVEPTAAPTPAAEPAPAANGLKDGSYNAAQDKYDDYGWKGQITIEVKDGKIGTVDFDYVNKENKLKSEDQGYIKAMEDKTKVNLAKAMVELESSLLSKQDAAAVDTVTSATATSNDFKTLAAKALESAK
ncbi:MAG TPA: FMN-binding protein [Clostridia bacterium]|nr:FMN-binding protein [Clostridia bacterium]